MRGAKPKAREFVVEIEWGECAPEEVLTHTLTDLGRNVAVEKRGRTLKLSSTNLEEVLAPTQIILKRLEQAGCQPTFKLSTRLPSEPTVISTPQKSGHKRGEKGRD